MKSKWRKNEKVNEKVNENNEKVNENNEKINENNEKINENNEKVNNKGKKHSESADLPGKLLILNVFSCNKVRTLFLQAGMFFDFLILYHWGKNFLPQYHIIWFVSLY